MTFAALILLACALAAMTIIVRMVLAQREQRRALERATGHRIEWR